MSKRILSLAGLLVCALVLGGPVYGFYTGSGASGLYNVQAAAAYYISLTDAPNTTPGCAGASLIGGKYGTAITQNNVTTYACNGAPGSGGSGGTAAWSSTTAYFPGDIVNYAQSGAYVCTSACAGGATNVNPATEDNNVNTVLHWMAVRGTSPSVWENLKHYFAGDIVVRNGLDYVCGNGCTTSNGSWKNDPATDAGAHWVSLAGGGGGSTTAVFTSSNTTCSIGLGASCTWTTNCSGATPHATGGGYSYPLGSGPGIEANVSQPVGNPPTGWTVTVTHSTGAGTNGFTLVVNAVCGA